MQIDLRNIKNIIFDLGNVLLKIHFDRTVPAFQKLGLGDNDMDYRKVAETPLFRNLEVGKSTPEEFRNGIREFIKNSMLTDEQIDDAWCAMLGEVPKSKVELLQKLSKNHKLFLYSNTNQIHIDRFLADFKKDHEMEFETLFTHVFYSHEIHDRKPEVGSFLKVLEAANIKAEESLFIDDLKANCIASEKAGIKSIWLKEDLKIEDLF